MGLDGINLDFESITEEQAPHYIQFVRELSIACRNQGIVFSIDDPVPTYSKHYDRTEQGIVADYVIIMGYDEHYAGSTDAGSVSSLGFVKAGIEDTTERSADTESDQCDSILYKSLDPAIWCGKSDQRSVGNGWSCKLYQ